MKTIKIWWLEKRWSFWAKEYTKSLGNANHAKVIMNEIDDKIAAMLD